MFTVDAHALFRRWLLEESGADLVEYAFLAGFVALATMAGYNAISSAIGGNYTRSNTAVENLFAPPKPPP